MDFALTESQQALQQTARKFAREVMRPKAAHYDETRDLPEGPHRPGLRARAC